MQLSSQAEVATYGVASPARRAGKRQDSINSDRTQQRALTRHVRPAYHDEYGGLRVKPDVTANASSAIKQRMAQALGVKKWRLQLQDRKCAVRILVVVASQTKQRIELADGLEPSGQITSVAPTPALHQNREICAPKKKSAEDRKIFALPKVQQPHQHRQPPDLARRVDPCS